MFGQGRRSSLVGRPLRWLVVPPGGSSPVAGWLTLPTADGRRRRLEA
jgi:hypothetical protein